MSIPKDEKIISLAVDSNFLSQEDDAPDTIRDYEWKEWHAQCTEALEELP